MLLTKQCAADFAQVVMLDSFWPLISRWTRATSSSLTLIDNVLSNDSEASQIFYSWVLNNSISDHLILFHSTNHAVTTSISRDYQSLFIINDRTLGNFSNAISYINWNTTVTSTSAELAFNCFYEQFIEIFQRSSPVFKVSTAESAI